MVAAANQLFTSRRRFAQCPESSPKAASCFVTATRLVRLRSILSPQLLTATQLITTAAAVTTQLFAAIAYRSPPRLPQTWPSAATVSLPRSPQPSLLPLIAAACKNTTPLVASRLVVADSNATIERKGHTPFEGFESI
ncbi:hypothetical protein NL676_012881 [Syzygium grande]|nr:hypothetical protein NL676_012881 [Syzygium grande]